MRNLEKNQINQEALKALIRWILNLTKESNLVHFFITSSEQFFLDWLETNFGSPTQCLVIGDLPKDEAHKYFDSLHPPQEIDFQSVFNLTGLFYFDLKY